MNYPKVLVVALLGMFLVGCQDTDRPGSATSNPATSPENQIVDRGIPSSKGPSTAPGVKGPSSAPPAAQAVTTNENIRLTLPLKNQK